MNRSTASQRRECITSIPPNTAFAFKILPTNFTEEYLLQGQTSFDWSAIYVQFTIQHAVSYLPNHFDRGYDSADLVIVSTKEEEPLPCIVYDNERIAISSLSSAEKAQLLTDYIQQEIDPSFGSSGSSRSTENDKPLLQRIGEDLQSAVVLLDAEKDFECAIPHCLMTNKKFRYQRLARFQRDPLVPWKVKSVHLYGTDADDGSGNCCEEKALQLSKDEKEDASLLGATLQNVLSSKMEKISLYPLNDR